MERPNTRDQVNELDVIISEYLPDHMPQRFWDAYGRLIAFAKQAGWPKELHEQYLLVLDERDRLQERIDALEAKYEPEPVKLVWRFACKHGLPNFIHCSECDG